MESETQVALAWQPLLEPLWLGVGGVLAVLVLALAWRSSAGVRTERRLLLLGLRVLGLLLLTLVLAGPTRVTTTGKLTRDPFVVLIDASRSMRVEDAGGTRAASVGDWLRERAPEFEALSREVDVRYVLFGDELTPWAGGDGDGPADALPPGGGVSGAAGGGGPGSGDPSPADRRGTDIGGALFDLPSVLSGARPAGVLLVSDGADRAALGRAMESGGVEAVSELVSGVSFPVSTWTVGDEAGLADLAVDSVDAPPFGFVRRPLTLTAHVSNRGLGTLDVPVTLRSEGEVVAGDEVRLSAGETKEISFEVRPDEVGYHTWEVELPVPPEDVVPSNNSIELTVKVVRDRTRVLQVTSRPSWDVKFLRRLLKTDPNIDLVSFFILRDPPDGELYARGKPLSLIEFPHEELFGGDLQGFDLVIFQNFSFGSLRAQYLEGPYLENIASYVEEGGAFLMVGGDKAFGAADYGSTPLDRVMPSDMSQPATTAELFPATLLPAGQRHPITRLTRDPSANPDRWGALPALQGRNPLGAPRDGTVELVGDGQGNPVVTVRSVGEGRTMAVATDTTWNWALAGRDREGAGQDHATFWRNAVRWLVKDVEQKQVQVITDKENYRLGETMQVQVQVLKDDYSPRAGEAVEGAVVPVRGGEAVPFGGETDASGQIAVSLPADREGTQTITATVPAIAGEFGTTSVRVSVTDREGELEDPGARPELLAAIAQRTGGTAFSGPPDPDDVPRRPVDALLATDRTVDPLWARGWWMALLVLPFGLEWFLRRRMGLR